MVEILDTTLREGEQSPNVTLTIDEKIKIANMLDEFGVDIIEAGHPIVSNDVFKAIKEISNQNLNAEIMAHCRAKKEDIDQAIKCDVDWVGIFLCVKEDRLKNQFKIDINKAISIIKESIQYAKDHGLKIRYTPEDATRTEYSVLIKVAREAVQAGADRISIADTVGAITPNNMYNLIKMLKTDIAAKLNIHCHNDFGLATANALAAYEAGISTIDVSINGVGERVGITSISEICPILHILYKEKNNWDLRLLVEMSQTLSRFCGTRLDDNSPIIGKNAFSHKAGLHVSAVVQNPENYEYFSPEIVGRKRNFIIDKMAGSNTLQQKISDMGLEINKDDGTRLMSYIKSKEKGTTSENEIIQILKDNTCIPHNFA
jgi:isopropylmalate/homocitrate/citramalate synthase